MVSNKKLFIIQVEDQYSSSEAELFSAANDGALEYAAIYGWSDISLVRSALPAKKTGEVTIHYFDIMGKGDAITFDENSSESEAENSPIGSVAAKEVNP